MKKKFILLPLVVLALGACANGGDKPVTPDTKDYVAEIVTKLEVGKAYKLGLFQENLNKQIYSLGVDEKTVNKEQKDPGFFATTENVAEAANYYLEKAATDGKFYVKYDHKTSSGETKQVYLTIPNPTESHAIQIPGGETPTTEWSYSEKNNAIYTVAQNTHFDKQENYYLGTYMEWKTIGPCDEGRLGGDFVARFYEIGEAVTPTKVNVSVNPTEIYAGQKTKIKTSLEPRFSKGEVTLSAAAEGIAKDKFTIDKDGYLTVDKTVPADTTVTVTATCGTLTGTATLKVNKYINFGDSKNPLDASGAVKAITEIGEGNQTPCKMVVKAVVVSNDAYDTKGHSYGSIVLKTGDDVLKLYKSKFAKKDNEEIYDDLYAAKDSMKDNVLTIEGVGYNDAQYGKQIKFGVIKTITGTPNVEEGQGGEGEGGETPAPTKPTMEGTLVGKYDLSNVSGVFNKGDGIYWGKQGEDDSVKFNASFVNSATETPVDATWSHSASGVEKAQLTQGPKVGGIKLNSKKESEKRDVSITLTLAEGQTIDGVLITLRSWSTKESFTYTMPGGTQTVQEGSDAEIYLTYVATDMNTFTFTTNVGRPVITCIELYSK